LTHATQILGEARIGWRLGEDCRKALRGGEGARPWERAEFGNGTPRHRHREPLASFGAAEHGGDVVTQLALRDDRHVG
jgi:hypothetical protein